MRSHECSGRSAMCIWSIRRATQSRGQHRHAQAALPSFGLARRHSIQSSRARPGAPHANAALSSA
eukprot:scaffold23908_cov36-Tisochrysis_lutea.AAC.2